MNVTVVGGKGRIGSAIVEAAAQHFDVRVADKNGGETVEEATRDANLVIVIVDTPSLDTGAYDISNVLDACRRIDVSEWRMVAVSCTVNPGNTEGAVRAALERGGRRAHADFGLAYVPEFVRQGSVLHDFCNPDQVVAGAVTSRERVALNAFYVPVTGRVPWHMSIASAEIAKIGLNTALTAKLAKANEIAWLCQRTPGADAADVLGAIGQDRRIGYRYFSAGPPPGGPCFPRDDPAFCVAQARAGLMPSLSEAVVRWQQDQLDLMADWVVELGGQHIGVVGLGFKPYLADATESPAFKLSVMLEAETYDSDLPCTCDSLEALVAQCDVIVLANPFSDLGEILSEMDLSGKRVVDWWGKFGDRFERFGVGPRC